MKSELKAKFLQHLVGKKKDQGFTLIELLVVIIIIGILSAIALPSFLNQANKAKQSEAKTYVGSLNRAQQAYYLEKSAFASDLTSMANPVPASTANYLYTIAPPSIGPTASVANFGTAKASTSSLKSYGGGVFVQAVTAASDSSTTAVLCESKVAATAPVVVPTLTGGTATTPGIATCDSTTQPL